MVKRYEYILFIVTSIIIGFFILLYNRIDESEKVIFDKIKTAHILNLDNTLKYISQDIILDSKTEGKLANIFSNKTFRKGFEKKLEVLISNNIRYAYILIRDKKGRYRFLVDGSLEDKAHFYQRFDVKNPKYDKAYDSGKPQIIEHKNMQDLWITYLYPVVYKNHTIALISLDTTIHLENSIQNLINPVKRIFLYLILFVLALLIIGIINTIYSIKMQQKLFIDPLTGLYNRKYLQEIESKLSLKKYAVGMIDIDYFKVINDTYGHKAGDYVLKECAKIFEKSIRESDIIVRYGGEEFVLLIYNRDSNNNVYTVADRIREAVQEHKFIYNDIEIKLTISIGLDPQPHKKQDLSNAIKVADKMLYIAKENGRNRVEMYQEKYEKDTLDINVTRDAIKEGRVICQYQQIYDPKTQKYTKYEALVRLKNRDNSFIYPNHFLPALKHTNVYYKLTKEILRINFDLFENSWDLVSINLSASDIINRDVMSYIEKRLKNNKELASRITFEVLESDEIRDIEKFTQQLKKLKNLGTKIAIDDFGSGFANFKMVLDIEADILKIDGSLIKEINENEKVYRVVKNIILFAKDVEMKTVAEFVSSKEIYDTLVKLGVDYVQGFYIAKPVELD